jgi:hypothetical protein
VNAQSISIALFRALAICYLTQGVARAAADAQGQPLATESFPLLTNISQLQNFARIDSNRVCSFWLTGMVCAIDSERGRLVLKDASDIEMLHVELPKVLLKRGDRINIEGEGYTVRVTEKGLWLGTGPVVCNDGLHPLDEKSGATYLKAGLQPIRIRWFNHLGQYGLNVDYEGPGIGRRRIPDSELLCSTGSPVSGSNGFTNGIRYAVYEGVWHYLPDFNRLSPTKTGTTPNFDLTPKTRDEDVGLQFDGYLKVPRDGVYTFYLKSDDGTDLLVGETRPLRVEITGSDGLVEGQPIVDNHVLVNEASSFWAELEGDVNFVRERGSELHLEVAASDQRIRVIILDGSGLSAWRLRNSRIRAQGICRTALTEDGKKVPGVLLTVNAKDFQVLGVAATTARISSERTDITKPSTSSERNNLREMLTSVDEVRRLSREQADRGYSVKIRGVLTCVRPDYHSVVIQDTARGIYAQGAMSKTLPAESGQYWEIEATTRSGEFAPVLQIQRASCLGLAQLPEPIHPTWDQLMNGSLDTQYVELQGIITESDENKITLLTRGGKINIGLPDMQPDERKGFESALIRLRGCLFASWDPQTHQVKAGEVEVYAAAISGEEPIPVDPFASAVKTITELRLFDPQANVFQRAKVSGQIVYGREGNYYLMNGANGMRFFCKNADVSVGDLVEVAGLPEWGALSPTLREAAVRKTGHAALPAATLLGQEEVADLSHDSTLVELEALLVNSRKEQSELVLELQSGLRTFLARVKALNEAKPFQNGSRLRLKGVYSVRGGNPSPGLSVSSFEILLNSAADITLLARPPWWTMKRVMGLLEVMGIVLLAGSLWVSWAT